MNTSPWRVPTHLLALAIGCLGFGLLPLVAQQVPATSSPQALQFLQQALRALGATTPITDITLTGLARRIAGSDDESGQAVLKALPSGASRMQFDFSSGTQTEIQNNFSGLPAGVWSGSDAVSHKISQHNLLVEPTWFFPTFPIMRRLSATYTVADLGAETHNGQSVEHLFTYQSSSLKLAPGATTIEHLSQMDFFLDSATFLPVAMTFNIHPDDNAGLDIPVEIRFSDYRQVGGAQVPFHVQQFINNSLTLDLQLSAASLNTALGESSFSF